MTKLNWMRARKVIRIWSCKIWQNKFKFLNGKSGCELSGNMGQIVDSGAYAKFQKIIIFQKG